MADRCGATGSETATETSQVRANMTAVRREFFCRAYSIGRVTAMYLPRAHTAAGVEEQTRRLPDQQSDRQEFLCSHYIDFRKREMNKSTRRKKCIQCGQLILGMPPGLKCTKFDFRRGSRPRWESLQRSLRTRPTSKKGKG